MRAAINLPCVVAGLAAAAVTLAVPSVRANDVVYSNDFETNTDGFSAGGSLSSLDRYSLPTDDGGLSSSNQSMWLGRLGSQVAKGGAQEETATLNVTGLTADTTYQVLFDLFIGASWDGAADYYGPDRWRLTIDGITAVDTAFSNLTQGVDAGAYSPQRYSDSFYTELGNNSNDVASFTGADAFHTTRDSNYGAYYGIYYFGHGAGNPVLTFTAEGPSAIFEFARFGASTDSADEYWALDNVRVQSATEGNPTPSPVPLPAALPVSALGLVAVLACRYRHPFAH